ncbi:MAG: alpha/beta hydrolase [Gemmataceae bacterium]
MRTVPLLALLAALPLSAADDKPAVLDVWPDGKPPGVSAVKGGEAVQPDNPKARKVMRITDIDRPTLTVFRPEKPNGASVVICPGGGYSILAWDLEGTEVAKWLNGLGVTAAVLKYRVPRPPGLKKGEQPAGPTQDGQRAVSLVRSKAKEWGLDPTRVGVLGFSAGGHLAASVALRSAERSYKPADAVDEVSCKPDFAVLIYPAYLVTDKRDALRPQFAVGKDAPPMFLVHAGDDGVPAESSVRLYLALKEAKVPSELHVYSVGGHGYGLRPSKDPVSGWPAGCADWLRRSGWLGE